MDQPNGSSQPNGSYPNGSHPAEPAVDLPQSLRDFLSDEEWVDLRCGLHELAAVRARNEAAAADIRI